MTEPNLYDAGFKDGLNVGYDAGFKEAQARIEELSEQNWRYTMTTDNKVIVEIASNGFVVTNNQDLAVFGSKREAIEYVSDLLPDIEAENAVETLRLRRKELNGKSLYDQYPAQSLRLQEPMQNVLRCFDNIIAMSACTGISERAIRNWLHYNDKTPSPKTMTRATRWLRNPTFVGEVQDDE